MDCQTFFEDVDGGKFKTFKNCFNMVNGDCPWGKLKGDNGDILIEDVIRDSDIRSIAQGLIMFCFPIGLLSYYRCNT